MNLNNKVYINPNFNAASRNNVPQNKLHVNPNFPQVLQNKNRIFVNPNFVNNSNCININRQNIIDSYTNINSDSYKCVAVPSSITNEINVNPPVQSNSTLQSCISKSRYSFVKSDRNNVSKSQENLKPKITVQINKYKSVAISNYKKSLDTAIKKDHQPSCSHRDSKLPDKIIFSTTSQYNHIKHSTKNTFVGSKYVYKKQTDSSKLKTANAKNKLVKRNLKKNNIPCPLFKKYGKCLRSMHSKCEFLHDKKHVSVCRKFLKGICHQKDCLLSHDITNNKMPTCYFYLKGICTRDGCPYLHVKLNDKTKVCPEFLKGYCDKGDKCLHRHIDEQKDKTYNPNKLKKQTYSLKNKKLVSVYKSKQLKKNQLTTCNKTEQTKTAEETNSVEETRYYKEFVTSNDELNETIEVLKPTRCKLGTLPSFIKL